MATTLLDSCVYAEQAFSFDQSVWPMVTLISHLFIYLKFSFSSSDRWYSHICNFLNRSNSSVFVSFTWLLSLLLDYFQLIGLCSFLLLTLPFALNISSFYLDQVCSFNQRVPTLLKTQVVKTISLLSLMFCSLLANYSSAFTFKMLWKSFLCSLFLILVTIATNISRGTVSTWVYWLWSSFANLVFKSHFIHFFFKVCYPTSNSINSFHLFS